MEQGSLTIQIKAEPLREAKCSECGHILDLLGRNPLSKVNCPSCGAPKTVPGRFAEYLVLELLGAGGMGAVYRGLDPLLDRPVALKVLLKSLRDNPELRDRFRREAKAAANINHPNVTHIYSFGEEDGQPYIVMEYVDGCSLEFLMNQETALDQRFVIETGLQIARGLQAGAKKGLVHGDVKPENILYDAEYTAKLIDFGLASLVDEDVKGGVWGSPYYLSPERIRRMPTDARSDIYSLGATLYHALAGCPPFDGESAVEVLKARLENPADPLSQHRADVHPSVERCVSRMLSLDVWRRHSDYEMLVADLQAVIRKLSDPVSSTGVPDGTRPLRTKKIQVGRKTQIQKKSARYKKSGHQGSGLPSGSSYTSSRTARRTRANQGLHRTTGRLESPSSSSRQGGGGGKIAVIAVILVFAAIVLTGIIQSRSTPSRTGRPPSQPVQRPPHGQTVQPAGPRVLAFQQNRFRPTRGYGGQGTVTVSDGGRTVTMRGPVWRAYPMSYTIQRNTVLEFEFNSSQEGLFQGIGFSAVEGARPDRVFHLYGKRRGGGIAGYSYAESAPGRKRYRIPVGQYYTGTVRFILFANDGPSEEPLPHSEYSSIKIYNQP